MEIVITTDGTNAGTKLSVDGKDVTKKENVTDISFYAHAPYTSTYSGDTIPAYISASYAKAGDNGTIERIEVYSGGYTQSNGTNRVGYDDETQKIEAVDQVVRFIGTKNDIKVEELADKIMSHCKDNNIKHPTKEDLLSRTFDSLKDKAEDLGIDTSDTIEDIDDASNKKYYAVKASETEGDDPKYPINNCKDVKDAWKLRSHGKGLKISQETLENRIKRRARALGCPVPGSDDKD